MPRPRVHTRIIQHPFAAGLQGARLDAYRAETNGKQGDIVLNYQAFERTEFELFEREGKIQERVKGYFVPAQVHFSDVSELKV